MQLVITEKQLKELLRLRSENQDLTEEGEEGAPEAGTSSDGDKKTGASKWESGVTRGPANQIGVTKWSEVVGSKITRGKANPLSEQSDYMMDKRANALANAIGVRSDADYKAVDQVIDQSKKQMFGGPIDPHTVNMVLGIGALFIPYVGPFISAGIGAYDAKLYYDEGDKKTAGLVLMFSLLPGAASIVSKIPGVKQLGTRGMAEIAKKLSMGTKLTNPTEIAVVKQVAKNRALIELELKKAAEVAAKNKAAKEVTLKAAKEAAKKQAVKRAVVKKAANIGKVAAGYGAAAVAYNKAYDKVVGPPKAQVSKQDITRLTTSKEPPVTYKEEDLEFKDGMWVPKEEQ